MIPCISNRSKRQDILQLYVQDVHWDEMRRLFWEVSYQAVFQRSRQKEPADNIPVHLHGGGDIS